MKSLHKKIGAIVLASGLLLGSGGLLSSSVVHADSSFKQLIDRIPEDHSDKKDYIGEMISNNGGIFKVISILKPGNKLVGGEHFSNYSEKKIGPNFIQLLREARKVGGAKKLGFERGCYYGLNWDGLIILIKVF